MTDDRLGVAVHGGTLATAAGRRPAGRGARLRVGLDHRVLRPLGHRLAGRDGPAPTSTITLASGIAYAVGRSPLVLACEARDLDELSGGRLLLGLGTGTIRMQQDWHGADGRSPAPAAGGAGAAAAPDLGHGRLRRAARGPLLPDGPAAHGRGHAAPADPGLPGRVQRADGAGRRGGGRRPGRAPDLHPALRGRGRPAGAGRRGGPHRARCGRADRRLRDLQRGRRRRAGPPGRGRADRVLRAGSDLRRRWSSWRGSTAEAAEIRAAWQRRDRPG